MRFYFLICLLLTISSYPVLGQDDAFYLSHYNHNLSYINPAFAGSKPLSQLSVLGNQQFIDNPDGPKDYFVNFNSPLSKSLGAGLQLEQQQSLGIDFTSAGLDLAYHLSFDASSTSKSTLSMGIHVSYAKSSFNLEGEDSSLQGFEDTWQPNYGVGFLLHNEKSYIGISAPKLFTYESLEGERKSTLDLKKTPFYLTAGTKLELGGDLYWRTSTLVRYASNESIVFDLTNSLLIGEFLEAGVIYRFKNTFGLLASIQPLENFTVGYAYYSALLLEDTGFASGSHEFMVNYAFSLISTTNRGGRKRSKYKPRYRR